MKYYVFYLKPTPAPRQCRSDLWKPRPSVLRYRAFKDEFNRLAARQGLDLSKHDTLEIVFSISMPKSWSEKEKQAMCGHPHQQKPDLDNLCKAVLDATGLDDSHVHQLRLSKVWAIDDCIFLGVVG